MGKQPELDFGEGLPEFPEEGKWYDWDGRGWVEVEVEKWTGIRRGGEADGMDSGMVGDIGNRNGAGVGISERREEAE